MYIPKATKNKNGTWRIQLRVHGRSIPVTAATEKECRRRAAIVKAEAQAAGAAIKTSDMTLTQAIDAYIAARGNMLSPSTIRGYRGIQKARFRNTMPRRISSISSADWRMIINDELAIASRKTVKNAWAFVRSVLREQGVEVDASITVPDARKKGAAVWLEPDEIKRFVAEAADHPLCVPMLLALMSMRMSEIDALYWDGIDPNADFIRTQGARVRDEYGIYVLKDEQKNRDSDRMVPLLIPELRAAIKRDWVKGGKVLPCGQALLRSAVKDVCGAAGVKCVTVHQLRHSFASLSAHLRIPAEISMEIGGWNNDKTMIEIYTHIARSDIERYQNAMWDFYNEK